MKYRAEIDGLRAVAVIPVIFYHAGFELFSGGFVGVDIFFVISGYLITTIILSEKEQGRFSLVNFYERRARRILPALFLVMFVSLPFAWVWLIPSDMMDFSQSLVAVSTFSSNILFWLESGYWGPANELKPLLHTWSLAIEEQYYVLFPLFLILMWRFHKRWILSSFLVIAAASLAISQWGAYNKPIANFFLLPTRGWELAIGASIAFYFLYRKQSIRTLLSHKFVDEALGLTGLLMIVYAVYSFDETIPFPSFYTLIPTIGTGLIIAFSSPQTLVGRLLGTKFLVGIGLISYSAYLWHQPLFAFARHRSILDPSELLFTTLAVLSFPLAYLSWRYVETPFRSKQRFNRKKIFLYGTICSAFFVAFGLVGHLKNGFEFRYTNDLLKLISYANYDRAESNREGDCFLRAEQNFNDFKEECYASEPIDNSIIIWGDSHAAALSFGLRKKLVNVTQLTAAACMPLVNYNPISRPNCKDINDFVLNELKRLRPELILLHADWFHPIYEFKNGFNDALSNTISHIKLLSPSSKIILIGGVPQWHPSLPKLLMKLKTELKEESYVYTESYDDIQKVDMLLSSIAFNHGETFVSILDLFCVNGRCLSSVKQKDIFEPFAWDYGHLTRSSSLLVSTKILQQIGVINEN